MTRCNVVSQKSVTSNLIAYCGPAYAFDAPKDESTIAVFAADKCIFLHGLTVDDLQRLLLTVKARLAKIDSTRTVKDNAEVNQTV